MTNIIVVVLSVLRVTERFSRSNDCRSLLLIFFFIVNISWALCDFVGSNRVKGGWCVDNFVKSKLERISRTAVKNF